MRLRIEIHKPKTLVHQRLVINVGKSDRFSNLENVAFLALDTFKYGRKLESKYLADSKMNQIEREDQ